MFEIKKEAYFDEELGCEKEKVLVKDRLVFIYGGVDHTEFVYGFRIMKDKLLPSQADNYIKNYKEFYSRQR